MAERKYSEITFVNSTKVSPNKDAKARESVKSHVARYQAAQRSQKYRRKQITDVSQRTEPIDDALELKSTVQCSGSTSAFYAVPVPMTAEFHSLLGFCRRVMLALAAGTNIA